MVAERLRVKGDILRGQVADRTPESVAFEPIHGECTILVPWADVQSLENDGGFAVPHGDEMK